VKNFKGDIIDSTLIKCRNFLDLTDPMNPKYDGRYLERYYNFSDSNYLSVRADSLAYDKGTKPDTLSQVDYQIKWLGKVDVWLDYVRVDDSWAHYLFTDTYEHELDPNNPNPWLFHKKIKEEVDAFKNMPGLAYFWVDECWYNNIPCITEVNRLVKEYSGGSTSITFIADPNAFVGGGGLRNKGDWTVWSTHWQSVYDTLFRMGTISNQLICQFFPQPYWVKYPGNLIINSTTGGAGYFERADNQSIYYGENEVANWDGYMTYLNKTTKSMKFVSARAKLENLPFGAITQLNSDEAGINPGFSGDWGLREPTNEEISVTNFLAMCYGAKQIYQFLYTMKI
jgi:hypothetical protein